MYRLFVFAALTALALPLSAFFDTPSGYNRSETVLTPNSGGNVVWDTAVSATDFYFWQDSGFRRFDVGASSPVATPMIGLPSGYFYFDSAVQNPANPDQFFVSFSDFSNSGMFLFTRTGADSATQTTTLPYNASGQEIWIYDLAFIPDNPSVPANLRGQLVATGADASGGFGGPAEIYIIDTTTLAYTRLADVGTTNGSGSIAVTSTGDIITTIPPAYPDLNGVAFVQFSAADLSAAIGGTPVAATSATELFASSLNITNAASLACRTENGKEILYWSSSAHGSVYRSDLAALNIELFMQGFGPFTGSNSGAYYGGSGIAFKSRTDDFSAFGGGSESMAVTFSISESNTFSNVFASVGVMTPAPANVSVANLNVVSQPSSITDGKPFDVTIEALNSGGTAILSDVAVTVSVTTGSGALLGQTSYTGPGDALVCEDLLYDSGDTSESIVLTFTLNGVPAMTVDTSGIDVERKLASFTIHHNPKNVGKNRNFPIRGRLRHAGGGTISNGPDSSQPITLRIISGSGTLSGTTTLNANNGVIEFDDLRIDKTGTYTLELSNADGSVTKTLTLNVGNFSDDDDDDSDGCSASNGAPNAAWALLLLALIALPIARRKRA